MSQIATYRGEPLPLAGFCDHFITAGYSVSAPAKFSGVADAGEWLVTVVDGDGHADQSITIADDMAGGWLKVLTPDADNDTLNIQKNGEVFKLDRDIAFDFVMKIADVSTADWFVGLAISDTDILTAVRDSIGFRCPDATGDIDAVCGKDATETVVDTGANLADGVAVRLRFVYTQVDKTARFYVNGVLGATIATNIPDDLALSPAMQLRNSGGGDNTMYADIMQVQLIGMA